MKIITNQKLIRRNARIGQVTSLAALAILGPPHKGRRRRRRRITLAADKAYDTAAFVAALRERGVTPHVCQNTSGRRSAIDGRTTRHPGYAISQRLRTRVEEIFGWMKTVGNLRKTRHRGTERVAWVFTLTAAADNLVRIRHLTAAVSP